jgi:hypothetical protein
MSFNTESLFEFSGQMTGQGVGVVAWPASRTRGIPTDVAKIQLVIADTLAHSGRQDHRILGKVLSHSR